MNINPLNVINLLLLAFQSMNIVNTPVNEEEINMKNKIEKMLLDCINEFNTVEIIEENTLDFQEPFREVIMETVEDDGRTWNSNDNIDECTEDTEELTHDYKEKAVGFWRSGKNSKNLALTTFQNRFRKLRSKTQLKRWAKQINKGGTYKEKISKICNFVIENFKNAIDNGHIVHDKDLVRWALQAKKEIGFEDARFRASKSWLLNFKKAHRIVGRKINKFVMKKTLESADYLRNVANAFVSEVKNIILDEGLTNVYNSDQSGFQLEMHSGRTLAIEGEKQVQCLVQSVSSTTHSYTIQPFISGDGRFMSPFFLVLKENTGEFGPIVDRNLFRPENVYVTASKSGKLTTDHFKIWLKDVFLPNVGLTSVLLLDSWSGHCSRAIDEVKPAEKVLIVKKIPQGTTGKIQPLDVYGFRIWKNYVRHFSDSVILMDEDLNLHLRNNIIKLQSLVHNQLSSPRYTYLFQYSWYKSGYIENRPDEFVNPVDFAFRGTSNVQCEITECSNVGIVKCSWCKKTLCLKHFFDDYHFCKNYEE